MRCAERFGNFQTSGNLNSSQMVELLALPAEETEKFIAAKKVEGQEIGKLVLLAEAKLGELFNQLPKVPGLRTDLQNKNLTSSIQTEEVRDTKNNAAFIPDETEKLKPKMKIAKELGFSKNQVSDFQKLADNPDAV